MNTNFETGAGYDIEMLRAISAGKRQAKLQHYEKSHKPGKPNYTFLPKSQKTVIDFATREDVLTMLEKGMVVEVCWILGVLADMKLKRIPLSDDHELALETLGYLFNKAVERSS